MAATPSRVPGEALLADRGPHVPGPGSGPTPAVGVLALQGDVLEHLRLLEAAGGRGVPVRGAEDLDGLDALVLPGGESTTIGRILDARGLRGPLVAAIGGGLPTLGTCAGAILLARRALRHDGRPSDQLLLGAMDVVVRRNAFGRQVASFEADIDVVGLAEPMHAVFIRAPWFEEAGPGVEILAEVDTPAGRRAVVARQGPLLASAFHPELSGDARLHALLIKAARR